MTDKNSESSSSLTGYDINKLARNYDAGTSPAKAVLMILATYANATTFELWPAKKTVINQANLSEGAGGRAFKKLITDGVLVDTGRRIGERGRVVVYRLNVAQLAQKPITSIPVRNNVKSDGSNTVQYDGSNTVQSDGRTTRGTTNVTSTKKNCAPDDAQLSCEELQVAQVCCQHNKPRTRPKPPIHAVLKGDDVDQPRERLRHIFEQKRQACGIG